jgi:hypothetical protein
MALIACAFASAATITVNCSTATGSTEFGSGSVGTTNGTITCADFNTSLGTLQSIGITLTGAVIGPSSVSAFNNDNQPHSGTINTNSNFILDASTPLTGFGITNNVLDGVDLISGMFNVNAFTTQTVGANPNYVTSPTASPCGSSAACNVGPILVSGSSSVSGTNTTNFAPYQTNGVGSFSILADSDTKLVCGIGGGQAGCSNVTFDSFTAQVVYTYNAPSTTPEPATLFLMGSALVGVGVLRKRFKS